MGVASLLRNRSPAEIVSRSWRYLRDRVVRRGLAPGSRSYRRFLVLGWYRTGSNLLVSLLGSHPAVVGYSEVFFPRRIFWGNGIYGGSEDDPALLALRQADPAAFLREQVFRPYAGGIGAVGFKVFYPQLEREHFPGLEELLVADPDLHVIHLRRENLLRILVSTRIAQQTGEMSALRAAGAQPTVRLEPDECRSFFEDLEDRRAHYAERFAAHPVLALSYEQLRDDLQGELAKVQEFLGVSTRPGRTPLVQQNTRPLSATIENHDALRAALAGSRWASFFES